MTDKIVVDNEEIPLNEWMTDEDTGRKTMYTRLQSIPMCEVHQFNKNHECQKCPKVFTGFRSHLHIQKDEGIYDRRTGKKIM